MVTLGVSDLFVNLKIQKLEEIRLILAFEALVLFGAFSFFVISESSKSSKFFVTELALKQLILQAGLTQLVSN